MKLPASCAKLTLSLLVLFVDPFFLEEKAHSSFFWLLLLLRGDYVKRHMYVCLVHLFTFFLSFFFVFFVFFFFFLITHTRRAVVQRGKNVDSCGRFSVLEFWRGVKEVRTRRKVAVAFITTFPRCAVEKRQKRRNRVRAEPPATQRSAAPRPLETAH